MIGIVVAAHGMLAQSFVETVQIFAGETPNVVSANLSPESGPEMFIDDLKDKAEAVDQGQGVLILVDLYGGTPGNSALRLLSNKENWVTVTGINLTMLLEVVLNRDNCDSTLELAEMAVNSSREGIQMLKL